MSRLIRACVCGATASFTERNSPAGGLRLAQCRECSVEHQVTETTAAEIDALYRGPYHAAIDRHPGCVPYYARYAHDRGIAALRLAKYREVLNGLFEQPPFRALDVGAANGAWVDHLRGEGLDAVGVDPDPGMTREGIVLGNVGTLDGPFSLVTYHDVLEHVVDPFAELCNARAKLRWGGAIVLDLPDVSTPKGWHHYKAEHIWFFKPEPVARLLERARFMHERTDWPIPGKFVVYARAI